VESEGFRPRIKSHSRGERRYWDWICAARVGLGKNGRRMEEFVGGDRARSVDADTTAP
jgi:hypothetical protein